MISYALIIKLFAYTLIIIAVAADHDDNVALPIHLNPVIILLHVHNLLHHSFITDSERNLEKMGPGRIRSGARI